jgi:hypothetical protein
VLLQEQPVVVLLLEGVLVSWSLAMDERGRHKDLRGSTHRSVIPYVHGRIELHCTSLLCLSLFYLFFRPWSTYPSTLVKRRLLELLIAQGRAVTLRLGPRQVLPRWLKPYTTSRVIMARSSKWCLVRRHQRWVIMPYRSAALNMARPVVPSYQVISHCSHVQEWSAGPMLHYRAAL